MASTRVLAPIALLGLLVGMTGCPEDSPPAGGVSDAAADVAGAKPVSRIALSHISLILEYDQVQAVEATVLAADGTVLTGHKVLWLSEDDEKVTVEGGKVAQGNVVELQAVGRHGATVHVTVDGEPYVKSTVLVSVPSAPVATVVIDPMDVHLEPGQKLQLTPKALDPRGHDITAGHLFFWTSSDPSIASVNDDGLVSAYQAGTVTITATCNNVPGTRIVTVGGGGTTPTERAGISRNNVLPKYLGQGVINKNPDYPVYDPGTSVVLTAMPLDIYTKFIRWTDFPRATACVDRGTNPTCTVVVGTTDVSVSAVFEPFEWSGEVVMVQFPLTRSNGCTHQVTLRNLKVTYARSPTAGRAFVSTTRYIATTAGPDSCSSLTNASLSAPLTGSLNQDTFDKMSTSSLWGGTERVRLISNVVGVGDSFTAEVQIQWTGDGGSGAGSTTVSVPMTPR
jgi:Bacterial Ig-like domain (group 2)/Divergent InlB B-repeat domain